MKITVLIPTYHRPYDLERCLNSLQKQHYKPHEVLLIVRDTDTTTHTLLSHYDAGSLKLRQVSVQQGGVVIALNAGLENATGDVIAITDDDAAPHLDWLERINQHFTLKPSLGGLGGRDLMYVNGQLQTAADHPGASAKVGKLQWFGRIIGNHHIGEGSARPVDILKGVNN
jgi:glycosyltransferase involved in cell wall biosynthesis